MGGRTITLGLDAIEKELDEIQSISDYGSSEQILCIIAVLLLRILVRMG